MKIINLLPAPRQQLLRQEAVFRSVLSFIWVTLFSFVIVIAVQVGVKVYLQAQDYSINNSIKVLQAQVDSQENSAVKKQVTSINNLITDYKNFSTAIPKWSRVLKAFAPLPPPGVTISSLTIDLSQKTIRINGAALTREQVIQLYNNILLDDKEFYGIDYPLENVAHPANVSFHFTFQLQYGSDFAAPCFSMASKCWTLPIIRSCSRFLRKKTSCSCSRLRTPATANRKRT
jgi:hypothetical protein